MSRLPEVYCAVYAFLVDQGHVKAALAVKKAALPVVDIETGPAAAPGALVELFARQVPVADANFNESSDHSSSSDDSSSSSSEDEAVASSAKVPVTNGKKFGTTNGSPKAPAKAPDSLDDSSDSSDSSDPDDSSSSDEDSSDSSSSSSDSSSDEEEEKAEPPAKPTTDSKQNAVANGVAGPTVNGKSKAKDSDSSSSSEDSSGSSSSESEPETQPPAKKRKVDADWAVPAPTTTTTETKTTTVATTSESVTLTESTTTSTPTSTNDKKKVKQKGPRTPLVPFSRIKADEVVYADPRLMNNSFDSKGGTINDYGERASRDLIVTRGAGFRKEKNKKKKGSYRGGEITIKKTTAGKNRVGSAKARKISGAEVSYPTYHPTPVLLYPPPQGIEPLTSALTSDAEPFDKV